MRNVLDHTDAVKYYCLPNVSVANSVRCFQRRLFVCLCVCQHDNFRTSIHRMMKLLGGRCIVQKSRPSSNLGVIFHWVSTPPQKKCGVRLRRWENQRRLSIWSGRCIVQESRPSSNLGIIVPWVSTPQNLALGYHVGKIRADCLVLCYRIIRGTNSHIFLWDRPGL